MGERALKPFKNFRWIVADPDLLGGKLAVRGTRFSVVFRFVVPRRGDER